MNMITGTENITVYECPIEVDGGEWIVKHPECDTVFEQIGGGSVILVYAYATSKKGNDSLRAYRDEKLPDKYILQGVSMDGLRQLI